MRLSIGDVHTGDTTGVDPQKKFEALFLSSEWSRLVEDRLRRAFYHSVVFAMVFESMPIALASEIHENLATEVGYLGAVEVHYEFGPHLAMYRVPEKYRIAARSCRGFITMGEEDGKDEYDLEEMRRLGYADVAWEDRGAHQTIFDDFDNAAHFARVSIFRREISKFLKDGEDGASELVLLLSDLSPKLFDSLGAAFERIAAAETEEEVAQAAVSGRRYLEQLAGVFFPATNELRGQRRLGAPEYRNRLWAFIEDNSGNDYSKLKTLGDEVDRLDKEFNGGVHGDRPKERILEALVDSGHLTLDLISLNPETARKPYFAFQDNIVGFLREALSDRG